MRGGAWNREVLRQTPGHKQDKNSYATPTPVTDGEKVYAVFGDGSFAAVTFDGDVAWTNRETGEVVWQMRVGGAYCASPVFVDGRIYLLSEQGETTVIAAGGKFQVLNQNPLGEKCQASMAVSGKRLLVRTEQHLWCIANP